MYTCLCVAEPYRLYSPAPRLAAISIAVRTGLARVPPPVASKASMAPVAVIASTRSVMKVGAEESQT